MDIIGKLPPTTIPSSYKLNTVNESQTNLIVNYLPQSMTSEEFNSIFKSIGFTQSCKLVKDKMTQQSLGYGFVNYFQIEDAAKAIRLLNGLNIESKVIKVSYARESCESIKGANLYICGIPKIWNLDDLNNYFSSCGKIITSRILFNQQNGQSKGVGFIRYDQKYEAEIALCKLNGTMPDGSAEEITVKFANYPAVEKKVEPNGYNQIKSVLSNFGNGGGDYIQKEKNSKQLGFHVVNQPCLNGYALPTILPNIGWYLSVFNLPIDVEEKFLWEMFGPFGAVQNVQVIRDCLTKKGSGMGSVTMSSYEEAMNAVNSLNGVMVANRVLQVAFKTY